MERPEVPSTAAPAATPCGSLSRLVASEKFFLLVNTNTTDLIAHNKLVAVIRACFGSEEDSIAISYSTYTEDSFGFSVPRAIVQHGDVPKDIPMINGAFLRSLMDLANFAMKEVKRFCHGTVSGGKCFQVTPEGDRCTVIEVK